MTQEILTEIGITLTLLALLAKLAWNLAQISSKVDTMWEFIMRRAISQALIDGHGTMHSPFVVTSEAKTLLGGLADDLRAFYVECDSSINDMDLALKIEQKFGEQILQKVCVPNRMTQGECLLIAVAVARDNAESILEQSAEIARKAVLKEAAVARDVVKSEKNTKE